jgi:hypothetical protein
MLAEQVVFRRIHVNGQTSEVRNCFAFEPKCKLYVCC